ncbi:MAG: hypothetical protein PWQ58_448 [Archaeoglobaceae archaeon]|nr:hypothetical protein [Archaeoglobaceae archaeon]
MDKKTISVKVDSKVWQDFKNYVLSKYGQLWRFLGHEVTDALKFYLSHIISACDAQIHRNQKDEFAADRKIKKHHKLIEWISQFEEIPSYELRKYINENFGIDRRTEEKYLEYLLMNGFIEAVAENKANGITIYRVNNEIVNKYLNKGKKEQFETEKADIIEFCMQRHEMGDSIKEIKDKLAEMGTDLPEKAIRNLIKKGNKMENL